MIKKAFCVLCAVVLTAALVSCSSKDESSQKKVSYDTEFKTADSFVLPTTPPMCDYTYTMAQVDTAKINDLVELVHGSGAYGKGKLTENKVQIMGMEDQNDAQWYDENAQTSAHLEQMGSFSLFKGKYSLKYTEEEQQGFKTARVIYAEDFDEKVTLDGKSVSYSTLTLDAQETLYDCFELLGVPLEVTPLRAVETADESGKVISTTIEYSVKFGTGVMTSEAFYDLGDSPLGASYASLAYPDIHTYYYTPDEIQGVWAFNCLIDNVQQGETISSPMQAEEAMKLIEDKVEGKPSDYTLMHCQLEYRPVSEKGGVITASPFWAFYYRSSDGKDTIIAVNVKTKETLTHEVGDK